MRTINVDLFTFNELSDEAKEKVIRDNREINVDQQRFTSQDFGRRVMEQCLSIAAFQVLLWIAL